MAINNNLVIGITEGSDPAFGNWEQALTDSNGNYIVSGAILITKNLHDALIADILRVNHTLPISVHATCTGWGGTAMEPHVPTPRIQLRQIRKLIRAGFPRNRITLRIDPIIDVGNGVEVAASVAKTALAHDILTPNDPNGVRVRVSVLDCYPHVRDRFRERGIVVPYNGTFTAPKSTFDKIAIAFKPIIDAGIIINTCAEPLLTANPGFVQQGCLSAHDLDVMGISYDPACLTKCQQRSTCTCLGIKRELLPVKKPCPHQCAYCYWRD